MADDEIALGRGTLEQLDKAVGDTVEVPAIGDPVEATIVGAIVAPAPIATPMDLDSGGSITFGLNRRIFGDSSSNIAGFLVAFTDEVDPAAARERLGEDFPGTVVGPMKPLDLADLERVRGVPYLLAGLLGAMALVSVVVTLATAARRRRREVAVLRSLGLAGASCEGSSAAKPPPSSGWRSSSACLSAWSRAAWPGPWPPTASAPRSVPPCPS